MNFILSSQDLFQWYQIAKQEANTYQVPIFELEYLLRELTSLNNLDFRLNNFSHKPFIDSKISLDKLKKNWYLRIKERCPIQYLIGECHWRNFSLKVTPDVLIPRPETELIIDLALELTKEYPQLRQGHWLDLGTGSGAIAIGLADVFPEAIIHAIDKSENALKIAQENAEKLGLEKKIKFYHGDWFTPIQNFTNFFSGIVSNPPYIPSQTVLDLEPEVVNHEPKMALDGGEDGLHDIRFLVNNVPNYLKKDGLFILEMMAGQGKIIQELLTNNGNYTKINMHLDLANLDRFTSAYLI